MEVHCCHEYYPPSGKKEQPTVPIRSAEILSHIKTIETICMLIAKGDPAIPPPGEGVDPDDLLERVKGERWLAAPTSQYVIEHLERETKRSYKNVLAKMYQMRNSSEIS